MTLRDEATEAQVRAARPGVSTWLAANAGSGKTRVLTDRVARLLLDGVQPQNILCLTYTKAAASEMQNRLFRRLGEWSMLDDAALTSALAELGVETVIDARRLAAARTLFARAIETPGGLKIQTIHSFCSALLRRFPLEARVSPQFTEIEDRAADLLRTEVVDAMAEGPEAALVAALAEQYTGEDFSGLTKEIVRHKGNFTPSLTRDDVWSLFGLQKGFDESDVEASAFRGKEAELVARFIPAMLAKGGDDEKHARRLQAISAFTLAALPELENLFLFGPKAKKNPLAAKIGSFPTKPTQKLLSEYMPTLDDFMLRVEQSREKRLALMAAQKTHALHAFAQPFLARFEAQKSIRGWLDFDDLILKARALLSDSRVAAWVLFRIDGGIDHILVDEAQDTSPAQWDVIRLLAQEFTSGTGARGDTPRTLFVVGDKKQSIYSFQGADPKEFDRMKAEFGAKFEAALQKLETEELHYSFRSSSAILRVVDKTFPDKTDAGFSSGDDHRAFKSDLPGRVDLWPLVEPNNDPDDRLWHEPLDRLGDRHHHVVLAERVAETIKAMIEAKETIPVDLKEPGRHAKRPVRPGDFLILVQRRSTLFGEIIRACKRRDLPIAGADRLKVGGELAVRDIAALLAFLATPEDSLSLATALRSPLFGWGEQALFDLAHRRKADHLWQALRDRREEFTDTMAILRDLRDNVDFLRPFDLIERILTRNKGRKRLIGRLGTEAEDGINALLSQALAYERTAVPSLTGFLVWMQTDDLEIKRQVDDASDQIRVMTVHGAKGLESPIVIMPDSGPQQNRIRDEIILARGVPLWKTRAEDVPEMLAEALDSRRDTDAAERLRLLYVALTRAEKWLIIAAAGDLSKQNDSWYQLVESAMGHVGATDEVFHGLPIKRFSHSDWQDLPIEEAETTPVIKEPLPACLSNPAPPPKEQAKPLSPSDLGGAKALPGELGWDEERAKFHGTLVHTHIERLSGVAPEALGDNLSGVGLSPEETAAQEEAIRVVTDPALRFLFASRWLSEVSVTADLGAKKLAGKIDHLLFEPGRILAIDFKTNRTVPASAEDVPEGILRQMGAYLHALQQIYPGQRIETGIVWTNVPLFMPLPHETVMRALRNTPYLDAAGSAP
jgi:ATP-dependent helicase/nuclease subunit A